MMEQALIYSRVATREHFFYRSPKLEIREESHIISVFWGFFFSPNTQLHISDKTTEVMLKETLKN